MNETYRVLGYAPEDARLIQDRHTNTIFPMSCFSSIEEIDKRREELRFNLRMAAGLYPWPEKTPLNPKYEMVGKYDGYTVQKVMFESHPGLWSTGNLYLPDPLPEKSPAILNVIGHWENQRLTREATADYPQQIANFAKMGFVCLVTDMIGKVDSRQLSHEYGGAEKELWTSNGVGIQLWNNIRALDLLCSLPYVDADRIGMTGASGGGSQTLFLTLLDERVKAAAPINMISLRMQGGCACENAPGLRRHTNNTEMCAMIAPRPLFLAGSTGDWTNYLETAELPGVLHAYRLYKANALKPNVETDATNKTNAYYKPQDKTDALLEFYYQDAIHQYNEKTRERVYSFFARHLMNKEIPWQEVPITVDDLQDLTWFRGEGKVPGFADDNAFFAYHKTERTTRVATLADTEKRKMLSWITGIRENYSMCVPLYTRAYNGHTLEKGVVFGEQGEKLPYVRLIPQNWDGKRLCLALSGNGKDCLDTDAVQAYLRDGYCVMSGDLFRTGEWADAPITTRGSEHDNRYFTTFQYTPDANRTQDAALLIDAASTMADSVTLWAEGAGARAAVCALALRDGITEATLEQSALQLTDDAAYLEQFFVPGICAFGGLQACLNLAKCPVTLY